MKRLLTLALLLIGATAQLSAQSCEDIEFPTLDTSLYQGVYYSDLKWENGSTLTVCFLNGSTFVRNKVKSFVVLWSNYANIHFRFVEGTDANIRVSFNQGKGSWSLIGRQSNDFSVNPNTGVSISGRGGPSMNFGWFNESTTDQEFRRTTLHEFGHALGLLHEHSNPLGGIKWNTGKVYAYYMQTQGWSKEKVDKNIFSKYSVSHTNGNYDPKSIMHYPISKEFTLDGFEVGLNTYLSEMDMKTIWTMYPKGNQPTITTTIPTTPSTPVTTNPEPSKPTTNPTGAGNKYRISNLTYGDGVWAVTMSKMNATNAGILKRPFRKMPSTRTTKRDTRSPNSLMEMESGRSS